MEVQVIPAITKRAAPTRAQERTRVAAYARVSTLSSEQEESFESQKAYFTELIEKNPEWELAQIYADRGKSGLNREKRPEFNRMMRDGKKGKFQILLVKSISRFARNTNTTIECIRELKGYGVSLTSSSLALRSGTSAAPSKPRDTKLIQKMEYTEKDWTIHFYGDVKVTVASEKENLETPRRLYRVTHPSPLKGTKRGTERRKR